MFRKRRSSQKPDEDFYAAFKQSFPDIGPSTSSAHEQAIAVSEHSEAGAIDAGTTGVPTLDRPSEGTEESVKDQDATPKAFADQWRLTPSLMDPAQFAFSAFTNQTPGYYTPTSGGMHTFYHSSAAGDLHTPGMGINTPLSMPHSLGNISAADASLHSFNHFNPSYLHTMHTYQDPFQSHHVPGSQQLYAPPSHFLQHQDSGYSGIDDSPRKITPTQSDAQSIPAGVHMPGLSYDNIMLPPGNPSHERFRFHTTLNAPTAMVRQTDEIPITYLNKGQAYTMSIFDTARPTAHPGVVPKYRTYVRVSFEDEQQRARPGSCWQLWKDGRGTNEAHQRGGKLLAVEYVDPNQGGDEELRKSQIQLETASFDGFAVTWYPSSRAPGGPDCSISVRFNFLSTDFSHSKGVKGIPVRLCAKTELISAAPGVHVNEPEVCFSKVKLFRDHGAERKLSNDVAHVKKSIDKLKQQISQSESGLGNAGKRKRSGSMASREIGKISADEDLHAKLGSLQDMFSSTRPVSVLFLQGDAEDDPDIYPVKLMGGEELKPINRTETWESRCSGSGSPSSNQSPVLSSASSTPKRKFSESRSTGDDLTNFDDSSLERPVKIQKRESDTTNDKILAIEVDSSYQPPHIHLDKKPVACFYIREKDSHSLYHRAIYVYRRTAQDLVDAIAAKLSVPAQRITKVTHINTRGLQIVVDDDVVRELAEGQDMVVELAPASHPQSDLVKSELWNSSLDRLVKEPDQKQNDIQLEIADALELWLNY